MGSSKDIIEDILERTREAAGSAGIAWIPDEREELLFRYIGEVHLWSRRVNLVGRANLADNICYLIIDSLIILDYLLKKGVVGGAVSAGGGIVGEPERQKTVLVADIGSGAGFPGLVWKIAQPDLRVTLFERRKAAAHFLLRVVKVLSLEDVDVVDEDAEAYLSRRRSGEESSSAIDGADGFDIMLAKAAGKLENMLPLAVKLLGDGGVFVSLKGAGWKEEFEGVECGGIELYDAEEAPLNRGQILVFRRVMG